VSALSASSAVYQYVPFQGLPRFVEANEARAIQSEAIDPDMDISDAIQQAGVSAAIQTREGVLFKGNVDQAWKLHDLLSPEDKIDMTARPAISVKADDYFMTDFKRAGRKAQAPRPTNVFSMAARMPVAAMTAPAQEMRLAA
jgi:hypothetical protein